MGDILKIGRVKFAVKTMQILSQNAATEGVEDSLEYQEYKEVKDVFFDESEITALDLPEED